MLQLIPTIFNPFGTLPAFFLVQLVYWCILYSVCLDLDFGSCLLDSTPRLPRLVGGRVAGARADRQLVAVVEGGGTEALVLTAAGEVASAKQSNQSAKWNNHKDSQTAKRCKIHQVPSHFKTKFQVRWQRPVGVVADWGFANRRRNPPSRLMTTRGGQTTTNPPIKSTPPWFTTPFPCCSQLWPNTLRVYTIHARSSV